MRKTFFYLKKGNQYFPIIQVGLKNRGREIRVNALVDSGASFSVFRSEIADYLGISLEKGKRIYLTGLGGRILGYLHILQMEVDGEKFRCKIIFSEELTISFNLLGRDNFFLPFLITFSEKKKKLVLKN